MALRLLLIVSTAVSALGTARERCPQETPGFGSAFSTEHSAEPELVLTLDNRLDAEITVSWMNRVGAEVPSASVAPLSRYALKTFPGHAFRVRALSGSLLAEVVANGAAEVVAVHPCGGLVPTTASASAQPATPGADTQQGPAQGSGGEEHQEDVRARIAWSLLFCVGLGYIIPRAGGAARAAQQRRTEASESGRVLRELQLRPRGGDGSPEGGGGEGRALLLRRQSLAAAAAAASKRLAVAAAVQSHSVNVPAG